MRVKIITFTPYQRQQISNSETTCPGRNALRIFVIERNGNQFLGNQRAAHIATDIRRPTVWIKADHTQTSLIGEVCFRHGLVGRAPICQL
jgi:hypothetical protein